MSGLERFQVCMNYNLYAQASNILSPLNVSNVHPSIKKEIFINCIDNLFLQAFLGFS
jgi:hypothetical protein